MQDSAIDNGVIAELQATVGDEFVAELIGTFLEEAPGMVAELRAAHAASDANRFRRAAHSLKANASTFGALPLAALARELELNGNIAMPGADSRQNIEPALAALESEYRSVFILLSKLKDRNHG
jgi:histidine phosphotransfer protein HptB